MEHIGYCTSTNCMNKFNENTTARLFVFFLHFIIWNASFRISNVMRNMEPGARNSMHINSWTFIPFCLGFFMGKIPRRCEDFIKKKNVKQKQKQFQNSKAFHIQEKLQVILSCIQFCASYTRKKFDEWKPKLQWIMVWNVNRSPLKAELSWYSSLNKY